MADTLVQDNNSFRDPKNLAELIDALDNCYQKRCLEKINMSWEKERIFLVNYKAISEDKSDIVGTFTMLGSLNAKGKREKYEIKLYKDGVNDKGSFWCSCPDHKFNSVKKNIVCKHICFLVCKIAKIFDIQFFNTKKFTSEHQNILLDKIQNIQDLILEGNVYQAPEKITVDLFTEKRKDIDEDDMCPICFDNINCRVLLSCPKCKNYIHKECIEVWLESKHTCVFCRSDIWKSYKDKEICV